MVLYTTYTTFFNILKLWILFTECVCMFHMVLTIHCDYFLKNHQLVDFCIGDVKCFLWGTN
jgi:hypothetical protein